jgi:lipopolysaccharide assembly protein A
MTSVKLAITLILASLVVVFIVQNAVIVEIRFLFWTLSMSRALVIFFALVIGMVIGWLLQSHVGRRRVEKLPHSSE